MYTINGQSMTSNNHHSDDDVVTIVTLTSEHSDEGDINTAMSGFRKQVVLYMSLLVSLFVVASTLGELSFSSEYSHFSSITAVHRDFIKKDNMNSASTSGTKVKVDRSNNNDDLEYMDDISKLDVHPNNNQKPKKHRHSRVVCLDSEECRAVNNNMQPLQLQPSWEPVVVNITSSKTRLSTGSSDVRDADGNKCELSDPSYQTKTSAPSTCNSIHEVGLDPVALRYLAKGAFKMAWKLTLSNEEGNEEHYVMKTALLTKIKSSTSKQLNDNTRDALIMERAGRAPNSYEANVLPMYQYCAISALVPFASKQPLDKYLKFGIISAKKMYHLAIQAARGLYQMQAYKDGVATYAHADVKPPQFLVFDPPQDSEEDFPLLQLNDFNRGRYIKRSVSNKVPCAFRMCGVRHKGSTYRSPEEYEDCADQSAAIDVYSLGGVFYFILSNGLKPYFQSSFDDAVSDILDGRLPELPDDSDYKEYLYYSSEKVDFAIKRSEHPLYIALQDVMKQCWSFKPEDRPTSLEVVQMLEEKLLKLEQDS
jgi:hypothetical protein